MQCHHNTKTRKQPTYKPDQLLLCSTFIWASDRSTKISNINPKSCNTRGGIFPRFGKLIYLSQPKKSVKWHTIWNSFFQTSNIVTLCLGPCLKLFILGVVFCQKAPQSSQKEQRFYENGISLNSDC